jgi:3' exoribonuclease, RNase T-like
MSLFIVDVEADGPCPGLYSMISFGAIKVNRNLDIGFYAKLRPISDIWNPDALNVSGFTREQTLEFDNPESVMKQFASWLLATSNGNPVFVSDNPAFDWQFINYYFHIYTNNNPFGFSARRIGDFYAGLQQKWSATNDWKKLRKTKHTHNPLDDATGNAEALIAFAAQKNIVLPN